MHWTIKMENEIGTIPSATSSEAGAQCRSVGVIRARQVNANIAPLPTNRFGASGLLCTWTKHSGDAAGAWQAVPAPGLSPVSISVLPGRSAAPSDAQDEADLEPSSPQELPQEHRVGQEPSGVCCVLRWGRLRDRGVCRDRLMWGAPREHRMSQAHPSGHLSWA